MHKLIWKIADNRDETALATAMRRKRFQKFLEMASNWPPPVTILDVGGTQAFWELMGLDEPARYQIVLLNLEAPQTTRENFRAAKGDARDLSEYERNAFDVVFSNSVIEHLYTLEAQECMAREVQRVGRHYFIQTPNRYFPIEPHFLLPFFQFYPRWLQIALLQRFNLGWYPKMPRFEQAREHVLAHRLLNEAELRRLFPGGDIYCERVFGLTKSFVAYGDCEAR